MTGEDYQARVATLNEFGQALRVHLALRDRLWDATENYRGRQFIPSLKEEIRESKRRINRLVPRVVKYLREVGYAPVITQYPAPAVGGPVVRLNLVENLFIDDGPHSTDPEPIFNFLDRASGAYEELIESGDTLGARSLGEGISLLGLLENKLRLMITTAPEREKEVQDAVETLFKIDDVPYSREADSFAYSSKNYVSDFMLQSGKTTLEVKLCARQGREKEIIAEINDDIVAYSTRYRNIIFLVYDVGQIRDVARFKGDLESNAKTVVLVVKH